MRWCNRRREYSCSIRHIQAHFRRDQYVFAVTLRFVDVLWSDGDLVHIWLAISPGVREARRGNL